MRANGVLIHWRWFRAYGNVIGGARPPGRSGPIQWNVVIYIKWPWIGAFLRCWFRLILYICEQFVYMCTMHRIIRSLLGGGCQWNFRKMMYFNAWKRPCRSARIGWDPKISPIEMPVFRLFSGGKTKSTDFFDTKYGGFAPKVRMFCLEKSDVLGFPKGTFCLFSSIFFAIFGCFGWKWCGKALPMSRKSFGNLRIWPSRLRNACWNPCEALSK